jgi:alkanesulfonate monooxygenase SsuD/methylene tetrahydromethanopterin reductase-like flavin-dependent oxidoreductase (luciferase family)
LDTWARGITAAVDITLEDVLRDRVIAGSPDECVDQLREWIPALGTNYVQLIIPPHRDSRGANLAAIDLIGKEVIPALVVA